MTDMDNGFAENGSTVTKARPRATDFMEIGSSGLVQYGGQVREDFLTQLQGKRGYANFREMSDNDPVIGAILHAVEMLVRGVDWTVEPSDPDDERSIGAAQFISECMGDMSHSWTDTLSSILSFLTYGFSYHEIIYKRRGGDSGKSETQSKFNDGMIGWRKLPIRSQDTVYKWDIDDNGGIHGMWQQNPLAADKGSVFIPIEKALLFRTTAKMNNPRGRSILRNAFVPWYYKQRIQEIEAIGIERDLAGMPVAMVPPQLLSDNATAQEMAALTAIKQIVRNIKRDEQEGIVFPLAYDPDTGNLAYDLKLLSTGGRRQFDTNAIIARYDQRMAMSVLADFVLLGHDKIGTQALSVSKIQLFTDSLDAWLAGIADVFNVHGIPRLMRLNGFDASMFPMLRYSPPANVDLESISKYLQELSGAGAAFFPDEGLEAYLRDIAGLPALDSENV